MLLFLPFLFGAPGFRLLRELPHKYSVGCRFGLEITNTKLCNVLPCKWKITGQETVRNFAVCVVMVVSLTQEVIFEAGLLL